MNVSVTKVTYDFSPLLLLFHQNYLLCSLFLCFPSKLSISHHSGIDFKQYVILPDVFIEVTYTFDD